MAILLEIKAGPFAGKTLTVSDGKTLVVGRAPTRAEFAIPHDTFMSGIHFAVEAGQQGARVIDKKSSNGTFLNGARIQESALKDGDEIRSGQTVFHVRLPPATQPSSTPARLGQPPQASMLSEQPKAVSSPETHAPGVAPARAMENTADLSKATPAPSAAISGSPSKAPVPAAPPAGVSAPSSKIPVLTVGAWAFHLLPEGWSVQKDFGLQQVVEESEFPSSIVVLEEPLGPGVTLPAYVESQIATLRQYLKDPRIDPEVAPAVNGSEENVALDIRHKTKEGVEVFYRRIYARRGSKAGVLTLTTLSKNSPAILESLKTFWTALSFRP
ncbi:MAG TPA: FHA domain-containing protein [Terriglobales bacterium]|nr:FHA domain-containing protein [Terriglobales bacterium]